MAVTMEFSTVLQQQLNSDLSQIKKVDLLNEYATVYYEQERLNKAAELCQQARELATSAGENGRPYQTGLAKSMVLLAKINLEKDAYSQTLGLFLEAIALLEHQDDPELLVEALNGIGWAYYGLSDYVSAQTQLERAIIIGEQNENWRGLARSLNTSAAVLIDTNESERAIELIKKSLDVLNGKGLNKAEAISYNNIAMALVSLGRYQEAEKAALRSLELVREEDLPSTESTILDTLGLVYQGSGDLATAAIYFRKAIDRLETSEQAGIALDFYLHLGDVLLAQGDMEASQKCLSYALELAVNNQATRVTYQAHERLSHYYELLGDYETALSHFRQYHDLKEEIFSQENVRRLADISSMHKIETALKDAEILRLKNSYLVQQIELEKHRHEELERQATTDMLTGLFNRRHFVTLGAFEFSSALKLKMPLAIIMLDVDHFKHVNDQYGHPIGDQVLIQLAAILNANIRRQDICSRYGGEEFLVLLPDSGLETGYSIATRLRKAVEEMAIQVGDRVIRITISAGISTVGPHDTSLEDVLARADQALLKAKRLGRNTVATT